MMKEPAELSALYPHLYQINTPADLKAMPAEALDTSLQTLAWSS